MAPAVVFAADCGRPLARVRRGLIRHFLRRGWQVVLATADDPESRALCSEGAELEPVVFEQDAFSPTRDLRAYRGLLRVFRRWRPRLAHHLHAKPAILGSIAARRALGARVRTVNDVAGAGSVPLAGGTAAQLAGLGYRVALQRADATVFQSIDEQALFLSRGWIGPARAHLITGPGVDAAHFSPVDRSARPGPLTVGLLARPLRARCVEPFVEVARRVRRARPDVRFVVAGRPDPAHRAPAEWLRAKAGIEYLGQVDDERELLARVDLLLCPVCADGTPSVPLEAAATALPVVGFDAPGLREIVCDGETGYLAPIGDVDALCERVTRLLDDHELRLAMGRGARCAVEESFDLNAVQERFLSLYRRLGVAI